MITRVLVNGSAMKIVCELLLGMTSENKSSKNIHCNQISSKNIQNKYPQCTKEYSEAQKQPYHLINRVNKAVM